MRIRVVLFWTGFNRLDRRYEVSNKDANNSSFPVTYQISYTAS
eukprot:gene2263-2478_t